METRFSENSFNIDNFLKRARFASLARNCIDKKLKLNQKFLKIFFFFENIAIFHACARLLTNRLTNTNLPIYLFFFFDRDGFATAFSIFSVKFDPYLSFDCSMKSCGETNVTLKKKKKNNKIYRIYKVGMFGINT